MALTVSLGLIDLSQKRMEFDSQSLSVFSLFVAGPRRRCRRPRHVIFEISLQTHNQDTKVIWRRLHRMRFPLPIAVGESGHPSNTMFLGPKTTQTGPRSVQPKPSEAA